MNKKQALIGLFALTIVFLAGLYLFAFSNYSEPTPPQYDFIYTTYNYSTPSKLDQNGNPIQSEESIINEAEKSKYSITQYGVFDKVYLYDTQSKTSKELNQEEYTAANKLVDDIAPDGYKFQEYNNNGGVFLPFGSSQNINVLTKDGYVESTKIDPLNGVVFVAWVQN